MALIMARRRKGLVAITLFAFLACLLAGCGSPGTCACTRCALSPKARATLPPPDVINADGEYKAVSEYRIGVNDLIEINVFQVAELGRAVRVNTQGQISLPLIGTLQAGGRTVAELEDIAARFQQSYIQDPQVTIFIKEFTSQRVTVEGAVRKPGIYALTGKTSLLQALADGRRTRPAREHAGHVIFRTVEKQKMAVVFDIAAIRAGCNEDPQIAWR